MMILSGIIPSNALFDSNSAKYWIDKFHLDTNSRLYDIYHSIKLTHNYNKDTNSFTRKEYVPCYCQDPLVSDTFDLCIVCIKYTRVLYIETKLTKDSLSQYYYLDKLDVLGHQ